MRRWEEQNTKTEQRIEILEWLATEIPARYPLTYDEKPNELMDVVVMWNDHTQTTHEHVMSLVRDLEASLAV
ncbi:hypothetical protein [Acinetobacter sp.]|uniref:DUF6197 family protein n=1 Tax=Acinetobacter sp. TaxID=472 RepID=UPI0037535E31